MPSDSDLSANNTVQPTAGQWKFTVYDHDFSSADGQAGEIANGVPKGEGYSTDFDINRIVNAARGDAPSADANDVGISFTSSLNVAAGGTYRLTTSSDDGSRIIIRDGKGNPVTFDNQTGGRLDYLNNDYHQGLTTRYGDVELAPGTYTIEILYWENQGANLLFGTISGPDTQSSSQDLTRSSMIGVPPALSGTESRQSVCFVRGTLIETSTGPRPVESLRSGDLIVTRDSGLQPIRWIGSQTLTSENLGASPKNRPIRIAAGALALNVPSQDLLVSPQTFPVGNGAYDIAPALSRPLVAPCFGPDVLVDVARGGMIPVRDVRVGDAILTADGRQPVLWTDRRHCSGKTPQDWPVNLNGELFSPLHR